MTVPDEFACCALAEGHDGPCQWVCDECQGTGVCRECGGAAGLDDASSCTDCGAGECVYCDRGLQTEECP